jgi:hypothetical protein
MITAQEIRKSAMGKSWKSFVFVSVYDNYYLDIDDKYNKWDKAIESGKSYLVGDSQDTKTFLHKHTSYLNGWQKLAYQWAIENPGNKLVINNNNRFEWEVYVRGEYVTFGLPHQDMGGERHYICKNGKSKVLINVD